MKRELEMDNSYLLLVATTKTLANIKKDGEDVLTVSADSHPTEILDHPKFKSYLNRKWLRNTAAKAFRRHASSKAKAQP